MRARDLGCLDHRKFLVTTYSSLKVVCQLLCWILFRRTDEGQGLECPAHPSKCIQCLYGRRYDDFILFEYCVCCHVEEYILG